MFLLLNFSLKLLMFAVLVLFLVRLAATAKWDMTKPFRIGIIVDSLSNADAILAVTNETVTSIFKEAVSIENRKKATISHIAVNDNNKTTLIDDSKTVSIVSSLVPLSYAARMIDDLQKPSETEKGQLIVIYDIARCAAAKCIELVELSKELPDVVLYTSCCLSGNGMIHHHDDHEETADLVSLENREENIGNIIYDGLEPDTTVDFILRLAKIYKWRRFHFIVTPDFPIIDKFVGDVFAYFHLHQRDIILTKSFYCTKKLADLGICKQEHQARRLILNKATASFILLESSRDSLDFVRGVSNEIRDDPLLTKGKAVFFLSLTGVLAPILPDTLAFSPNGLMLLRKKKPQFTNYRTFTLLGMPNAEPAFTLYSAIRILSKAIEVFAQNQNTFNRLPELFCSTHFKFLESPKISLDFDEDCGNHYIGVEVWNVQHSSRKEGSSNLEKVFEFSGSAEFEIIGQPQWVGSGGVTPRENECELEGGGFCPIPLSTLLPPSITGSVATLMITVVTCCCVCRSARKRKLRKQKTRDSVIAHFEDLEFVKRQDENAMEVNSRASSRPDSKERPAVVEITTDQKPGKRVPARWHQEDVYLSMLSIQFREFDDNLIQEILQIKALRHPNINPLVAVTVDAFQVCVLHEYCAKGTLSQVLARKSLQLNRMFKVSFANDVASGMAYLHQSNVVSHGELSADNVLVDARWFCKISNIPLLSLTKGNSNERSKSTSTRGTLMELSKRTHLGTLDSREAPGNTPEATIWTAPELMRIPSIFRHARGSQKGDVYSYGIIVFEIATRQPPFVYYGLLETEILSAVHKGSYPPFRPKCVPSQLPSDVADLLQLAVSCWDEVPVFRPTFPGILRTLQKMSHEKDVAAKLVDEMIATMEHYAENLEATVCARTQELTEEQRRSEDLLSKMLPRSIIEELKSGRIVHPESFESVTVYFSDIVGFTKLAAESAALEVVNLLNDLYSEFDNVIDLYNVYKVETISDAYMVASGLPIRNTIHASEIATMALDIMSRVTTFQIRHRPGTVLQLRIGIHSGPVVAGIVGLTMPRYCLFGDTVNYASRMESSSLALRIHVSPESKNLLDKIGGFQLEKRGFVTMKGKGSIQTYHLIGKDGFTRPLPDLSLACSLAEHEFK